MKKPMSKMSFKPCKACKNPAMCGKMGKCMAKK